MSESFAHRAHARSPPRIIPPWQRPFPPGTLATIGRNAAVVDLTTPLGRIKFSGYPAWLFWLVAHVYFLIGFRNRMVVLLDWASAYWSRQRYARVVTDIEPAPVQSHPGALTSRPRAGRSSGRRRRSSASAFADCF
jgi:hypothetical protein